MRSACACNPPQYGNCRSTKLSKQVHSPKDRNTRTAPAGPRKNEDRCKHSAGLSESQQQADWRELAARIGGLEGPLRFTAYLRPTLDALHDPRFASSVLHLLMECGVSAMRGGSRECHGCC